MDQEQTESLVKFTTQIGCERAEVAPGIIETILSWILNTAADVVGWVSQNLWALVVGIGGLLYPNMVTKK